MFIKGKLHTKKTMEEKEEKGEEKEENGEEKKDEGRRGGKEERKKNRRIDSPYPGLSGPSHLKGIS